MPHCVKQLARHVFTTLFSARRGILRSRMEERGLGNSGFKRAKEHGTEYLPSKSPSARGIVPRECPTGRERRGFEIRGPESKGALRLGGQGVKEHGVCSPESLGVMRTAPRERPAHQQVEKRGASKLGGGQRAFSNSGQPSQRAWCHSPESLGVPRTAPRERPAHQLVQKRRSFEAQGPRCRLAEFLGAPRQPGHIRLRDRASYSTDCSAVAEAGSRETTRPMRRTTHPSSRSSRRNSAEDF